MPTRFEAEFAYPADHSRLWQQENAAVAAGRFVSCWRGFPKEDQASILTKFAQLDAVVHDPETMPVDAPPLDFGIEVMPLDIGSDGHAGNTIASETTIEQRMPVVAALGRDPGDGEDNGGDVDGGEDGGDGIAPEGGGSGGDIGHDGGSAHEPTESETGAESGEGNPSSATQETAAETPAAEPPSSQTGNPTGEGSEGGRQFSSSSPETGIGSNTIHWEAEDEVLSPPSTTPAATTGDGRNWVDSALDYFDVSAIEMSGASQAGMPSVGSVVRTIASGVGAIIAVGGLVAAAFFASTYSRHSGSGRHRDDNNGGHDSDPSHAVISDAGSDGSDSLTQRVFDPSANDPPVLPTPHVDPAATLRIEFAVTDSPTPLPAGDLNNMIPAFRDSLSLWLNQPGSALHVHFAGHELLSASSGIAVTIEIDAGSDQAHPGVLTMIDLRTIINSVRAYCAAESTADEPRAQLEFTGVDVISGEIVATPELTDSLPAEADFVTTTGVSSAEWLIA